jgi:DNA-directed RNA polymerase specialized sigma24 family protein
MCMTPSVTVVSLDVPVDSDRQGPWQVAEPSNDPEWQLLEREMQFQIRQAVGRLRVSLRLDLEPHRFRDRPLKELASMTGLTVTATKSRLYRARLAVRDSIQPCKSKNSREASLSAPWDADED